MSDLDLDDRELCPDGACIGVIGPDGKCKECGTRGTMPVKKAAPVTAAADADEDEEEDEDEDDDAVSTEGDDDVSPFDDDRALCPDGACIGVIGADGRCKECGKRP